MIDFFKPFVANFIFSMYVCPTFGKMYQMPINFARLLPIFILFLMNLWGVDELLPYHPPISYKYDYRKIDFLAKTPMILN